MNMECVFTEFVALPNAIVSRLPNLWETNQYSYFWGGQSAVVGKRVGRDFDNCLPDRAGVEVWDEGQWRALHGPPISGKIYRMHLGCARLKRKTNDDC